MSRIRLPLFFFLSFLFSLMASGESHADEKLRLAHQLREQLHVGDSEQQLVAMVQGKFERERTFTITTYRWSFGLIKAAEVDFLDSGKAIGHVIIGTLPRETESAFAEIPDSENARSWLNAKLGTTGIKARESIAHRYIFSDSSVLEAQVDSGKVSSLLASLSAQFVQNAPPEAACRNDAQVTAGCEKAFGTGTANDPILRKACRAVRTDMTRRRCESTKCLHTMKLVVACPNIPKECEHDSYSTLPGESCED